MVKNYFNLALRHLSKNRTYAAINILGLAIGVAACLLIFRLVRYELSFNSFYKNQDRIVRIVTHDKSETEGEGFTPGIPIPAMDEMQETVTQFAQFARVRTTWPTIAIPDPSGSSNAAAGRKFNTDEERETAIFTEPAFFHIFDWQWLSGDPKSSLSDPNSLVMARSMAEKCFGTWQMAVGQTVLMDNAVLLKVNGIVEDSPENSDFQCHLIISYATLKSKGDLYGFNPDWGSTSSNDQAFALLHDRHQWNAASASLAKVGQEAHYKNSRNKRVHVLQALSDLHYDDRYGSSAGTHVTRKSRLWVLSSIGLLVLIMACFNFVNLATAQAASRSREVGVRKSLGGSRGQLVAQFMGETAVIVTLAVATGAALAAVSAPLLQYISNVPNEQPFLSEPITWLFLALTTFLVSAGSGFYPALILSGFEPVKALKNSITSKTVGGVSLRKILVVGQFVIAQALIIGTLVTVSQMDFLQKMDLGFKPDLVYVISGINGDSLNQSRFERFKSDLKALPAIKSVSFSSDVPSSNNNWASNFALGSTEDAPFATFMKIVDADYFETYGLRLVAGKMIQPSDTARDIVVNEFMLRKLGYSNPEEVLGKNFRLGGGSFKPVVGVVADFTANSAHEEMKPMAIFSRKEYYGTVGMKIQAQNLVATTAEIQRLFERTFPEQVFDGQFMDERIAEFYRDEARFSALCKGFAGLAILISCLGLYGLATLSTVQRTKEIGIRKVLGASVGNVVGLLSKDFLLLVLLAAFVAIPLAWYAMNAWLQDFVYRTALSWWIFAGTIGLSLLVALITVGLRAWSAARANPVRSLRSE